MKTKAKVKAVAKNAVRKLTKEELLAIVGGSSKPSVVFDGGVSKCKNRSERSTFACFNAGCTYRTS